MQFVTFYISGNMFGVPILSVREISRPCNITEVQGADEKIEGLINLRGQIVTVLNLGSCLGVQPVSFSSDSRLVILKNERELPDDAYEQNIRTCKENIALLVSKIGDVVQAQDREMEPPPAHTSQKNIDGIIKLENELLTVLSTKWLCAFQNEEKN